MANWNFNSGTVIGSYTSQLERNQQEENLIRQLNAEAENYRLLREHQAAMQTDQQRWQSGESGLTRKHQSALQDDEQRFTSGENRLNRAHQWGLAYQASKEAFVDPYTGRVQYFSPFDGAPPMATIPNEIKGMPGYQVPYVHNSMYNMGLLASSPFFNPQEPAPHVRTPAAYRMGQDLQDAFPFFAPTMIAGGLMKWWNEDDMQAALETNKYIDRKNALGGLGAYKSRIRSNSYPRSPEDRSWNMDDITRSIIYNR